ncbi:DEK-like isoform X2 isoform B [Chlorella sorokiniana]|uniref:DEK-like isoform X2 isoform B n=1 Tax=Chlorella sorokiniana TaxID=3076 RepID=A0A2P6U4D5_CHLSO|nr:DEK-like isoform X2 isoform B [Chlorella sorokiniana]|eukprot:PRW61174.1 DEK-like isoform X2 isoform B [Chlorella sorokiniana]
MHTSVAAVVLGGSQEAAEAAPHRPPASPLAQVEALGQALPLVPAPANLLARQALHDAALDAVAAVGPIPPDCLEACCLRDDLHLFIPAGPARSLLTWARLPLPLLYEGGQFSYPLRQVGLPAPLLQLALNRRASIGWDSCLWHTNLPMLAARSEYAVTLLQLAPGPGGASSRPEQGRQARARSPSKDDGSSDNDASQNAEQQSSSDEWEDDGGGFDLRQLCVVGTRSPTAHTCWQRHLAQQPLLLLQDGTLLEAQLQQDVQVVEAWRPPAGAVPARLQGVLQVAGGAQPRTALLALHNRLSRLDLRSSGGALSLLWQCPQGQHLTAICAPAPAGDASASGADEHLLAATTGTSAPGSGARVLLFDLRRPGQPVATWDQPQLGEKSLEAGTLLRWLPTLQPSAGAAASNSSQQLEAGQPQGGGLLLVGSSGGGQVVGCQFAEQAAGPALQARGGQIQEKPSTAAAALLERLQASLEQQQQEQQAQDQQAQAGGSAAAQLGTAGTPPAEQQLALQRWVEAGRLRLQKLSTATGVAIQFGMISEQQKQPHQLAGLAAVAADWATGQGLPVPLLCSLTPRGDVLLSLLREGQGQEAAQQMAAAAAPPLLVPVGQGQPDDADSDDEDQAHSRPAGMQRLPYVRGVPRAVVAAVRDGTLALCGCCRECLRRRLHSCVTRKALRQAGLLKQAGERRGQDPAVVTMPAGDSERSVVQLPLHTALAQRLVRAQEPATEAPAAAELAAEEAPAAAEQEAAVAEGEKKTPKAAPKPRAKPTPASEPAAGTDTGGRARRERKQVERFQVEAKRETEEVAVPQGSGERLRDIPNVAFKLGKLTGKDELVEGLHMVMYRRKGAAHQRKKAVLDFCGFAFAEDQQAKEVDARKASLGKWKLELLHKLMDVLDLQRGSGDKGAKIDRVLEFLQSPKALSDVDLAAKEADKKAKEKAKRERAAAKKEKEKAKQEKAAKRKSSGAVGRPAKKAKKEAESEEEPESEPEESEEEEGSDEEQASDFEAEELGGKKGSKKAAGGSAAKRGRKAAAEREEQAGEEGGAAPMEEDEQPAQDPASQVPADELRREVEGILAGMAAAELRAITAKPILKQLEAKYGFSLRPRKQEVVDLAHAFVIKYFEDHPDEEEQEQAGEGEEAAAEEEEAQPAAEEAAAAAADEAAPADEAAAEEAEAAAAEGEQAGGDEPAVEEAPAAEEAAADQE